MKKLFPLTIVAILIVAVVYAFLPKPVAVDLVAVTRGPLEITVDEEGKTRIRERYVVSAPLAGRLRRIELDPGDAVKAGQTLLAVIEPGDPALLDARSLAEAEARVKAARASVQQADSNLERCRAALEFSQNEHRRARQLAELKNISIHERENAELSVRTRSEDLKSAEFSRQIAQFELEQAEAALLRSRPDNAESSVEAPKIDIRSPIDGRVLHVKEENAGIVMAGTGLIELGDPSNLEIVIDVLSSDAVNIHPGTPVRLEHWGGQRPLMARVRLVEPAAFTKVSALGVEEQRVNVVADLDDPPEQRTSLGDGYRVEARIIVWQRDEVLRVPSGALFRQGNDWVVFRMVSNRAVVTPVKIGRTNALDAEVLEGLREGDRVVAHPSDKVVGGVRIVPR
jgi:HlyD family secretion protein